MTFSQALRDDLYDPSFKEGFVGKKKLETKSFYKRAFVFTKQNAFKILNVAQEISSLLPRKEDGLFVSTIKVAGIFNKIISMGDKRTKIQIICNKYDAVFKNNKHFVNMFVSTGMIEKFDIIDRDPIDEHQCLLRLRNKDIGDIFLMEVDVSGELIYRDIFFHSKNLDFEKISAYIWSSHEGRIDVKSKQGLISDANEYVYSTFPYPNPPAFGGAKESLEALKNRHNIIMKDNISRTYLFLGLPGVGKTTLALRFATEAGGKIIRMGANLIHSTPENNLRFLFDILSPNFIIIDDIDKASSYKVPELLTTFEHIKQTHPNVSIILTANKTKDIEPSLLRPGRVDNIVYFELPNEEERLDILEGYVELFEINVPEENLKKIASISNGMTGAWLKEVCIQLKYSEFEDVEKYIVSMNKFISKDGNNDDYDDECGDDNDD